MFSRQSHVESIHTSNRSLQGAAQKLNLYAAALGASESEGMVSLLCDLGNEMKPVECK